MGLLGAGHFLFILFFFLFFKLSNISCPIFMATDSFFLLKYVVEPLFWIFHYSYCTFQFHNFCLVSFYNFCLFKMFSLWSEFVLMVSFRSLSIFKTVDLNSWSSKSNVWTSWRIVSTKFWGFFPVMGHTFAYWPAL